MILYYFPIAKDTGPNELHFGSNLFVFMQAIICDYYLISQAVMCTLSECKILFYNRLCRTVTNVVVRLFWAV